jgi:hypothetical protein
MGLGAVMGAVVLVLVRTCIWVEKVEMARFALSGQANIGYFLQQM